MELWQIMLVVFGAGGIGGVVAALISEDRGFKWPTKMAHATGTVYRPGFLGLIFIGGVAAAISWGLYGPLANENFLGGDGQESSAEGGEVETDRHGITVAALVGAIAVGTGGSKWLSAQVDKALLRQTAVAAASAHSSADKALRIREVSPSEALTTAKSG